MIIFSSCGLFEKDSDDSEKEDVAGQSTLSLDNGLGDAYPSGLNVTTASSEVVNETDDAVLSSGTLSISYESDTALALAPDSYEDYFALACGTPPTDTVAEIGEGYEVRPPKEQFAEHQNLISGSADECISANTLASLSAVVEISQKENLDKGSGCFRPDWGIIQKDHTSGDPCMVGTQREQLKEASAYLEATTGFVAALLCEAKKQGKAPEEGLSEGSSITGLEPILADAFAAKSRPTEVIKAEIKRLPNRDGSSPVYRTDIILNETSPFDNKPRQFRFQVVNSPNEEGSLEGRGRLWLSHDAKPPAGAGDFDLNTDKMKHLSLAYIKEVETTGNFRLRYELKMGVFDKTLKWFTPKGELDFNMNTNASGNYTSCAEANKCASRMKYVSYDGFPEFGVGRLSYWVNFGGRYAEAARGYTVDLSYKNSQFEGCAAVGASSPTAGNAISIRKSIKDKTPLKPSGYYKPFDSCSQEGTKIWSQCFKQQSDGKWIVDTDKTKSADGYDFVEASTVKFDVPKIGRLETEAVDSIGEQPTN